MPRLEAANLRATSSTARSWVSAAARRFDRRDVDLSNHMQRRKVTYKLYPNASQADGLLALLRQHKDLWNAALEERIDAYRKTGKSISYEDQCASLTQIRQDLPDDWAQSNCSAQQITLRRLDKAFKAFFARCAKGQSPGFPRFKSIARMPGLGFKGHGDGWRFAPNIANEGRPDDFVVVRWAKHGTLRLQSLGHIKCRGQARSAGIIKSCELLYRYGEWSVSVTLECADADVVRMRTEHHAFGADWGVNKLLTLVRTDGAHSEVVETIENPRWIKPNQERLVALDRWQCPIPSLFLNELPRYADPSGGLIERKQCVAHVGIFRGCSAGLSGDLDAKSSDLSTQGSNPGAVGPQEKNGHSSG